MTEAAKEKEALKKEIGRRFKEFRNFIKKNRQELADELQISKSTIENIELGHCFPGIPIQNYLNIQYHLNFNWLLTGNEEMIIPPVKDSKTDVSIQLDDNDPRFEKYAELYNLLKIPVIEKVIFAKLSELKIIAEEEIKSFFEGT